MPLRTLEGVGRFGAFTGFATSGHNPSKNLHCHCVVLFAAGIPLAPPVVGAAVPVRLGELFVQLASNNKAGASSTMQYLVNNLFSILRIR
jgi:hypothetical protein